ncbi:SDR family oxidoreductase [Algoriphagus sediminis]|uniref:SDR family oxidoreductase n=1 Tax=Algoriphagus sediminis TaxID=3057113 RepID=A0ABT7YAH8_9BACT|nr:SDR family oxidoreductase [Algoriphagus sediminis]MDN3203525.1 SDR family oxidoreductase [Algoriphagus sediminis]
MNDKVIWITGASSGIGEACAKKYIEEGWKVILSARNERELDRVRSESAHPENAKVLILDLTETEEIVEKTTIAIELFGHIDVVLHSGGISQRSLIKDTTIEVDRRLMEVNFFGTVALSKAILPHFLDRKSGAFGIISSLVGKFGTPYRSSYSASKHALHGFFDTLRAELYKDKIQVTIICPGFIKTNVSVNALTEDGSPLNKMDDAQANGMSPEKCAEKIFSAMKKKKREVYIGGKEVFGVYAKRFFPGLFSKLIQTAKVR